MKILFEKLDNALRHGRVLREGSKIRKCLKKPYLAFLRLNPAGYSLNLGGAIQVNVPPEYASKWMEQYEQEEFAEIVRWCRANRGGLFVDIGCSHGFMSCAALFADTAVSAIAIDSDLNSLQAAGRVCRYATEAKCRLHRLHAMMVDRSDEVVTWAHVEHATGKKLEDKSITGAPGTHRYINLNSIESAAVPKYCLDDLLAGEISTLKTMLIKCDVEGAEFAVLSGARRLMQSGLAVLLLSVHPKMLTGMGHSVEDVETLLRKHGYTWEEISIDHERHWLCIPPQK